MAVASTDFPSLVSTLTRDIRDGLPVVVSEYRARTKYHEASFLAHPITHLLRQLRCIAFGEHPLTSHGLPELGRLHAERRSLTLCGLFDRLKPRRRVEQQPLSVEVADDAATRFKVTTAPPTPSELLLGPITCLLRVPVRKIAVSDGMPAQRETK